MDARRLERFLAALRGGTVGAGAWGEAVDRPRDLPYDDLGFAKVDAHRALRRGFPEVVYCPGKTAAQIVEIVRSMRRAHDLVLATRASAAVSPRGRKAVPRA